jgi:hypothetical protein
MVGLARKHENIVVRLNHGSGQSLEEIRPSAACRQCCRGGCIYPSLYWSSGRLLRWRGDAACACCVDWAEMFWLRGAYGNACFSLQAHPSHLEKTKWRTVPALDQTLSSCDVYWGGFCTFIRRCCFLLAFANLTSLVQPSQRYRSAVPAQLISRLGYS